MQRSKIVKFLLLFALMPLLVLPAFAQSSQTLPTEDGTLDVKLSHDDIILGQETKLRIDFINPQSQKIQEHIDYRVIVLQDDQEIFAIPTLTHTSEGSIRIPVEFTEDGMYDVRVEVEGILFQPIPVESVLFGVAAGDVQSPPDVETNEGGCLIATATYGSELAPQVQQLRELRDGTILNTESGTAFMAAFNQAYYWFSPSVADLEREQPLFREAVKLALMPMLSSLSLLGYAEINSELEMLGYGISVILLNIGMYAGIPTIGILKLYRLKTKNPQQF